MACSLCRGTSRGRSQDRWTKPFRRRKLRRRLRKRLQMNGGRPKAPLQPSRSPSKVSANGPEKPTKDAKRRSITTRGHWHVRVRLRPECRTSAADFKTIPRTASEMPKKILSVARAASRHGRVSSFERPSHDAREEARREQPVAFALFGRAPAEGIGGIDAEDAHLAREEAQLLQRQALGPALRVAV